MIQLKFHHNQEDCKKKLRRILMFFCKQDILGFLQIAHQSGLPKNQVRELLFELSKMNKISHDEIRDLYYLL